MIEILTADAHNIASIMPVMDSAFDPAFGEAWTPAQCMATLSLPDTQLLIARAHDEIAGFAISRWVLDEEELMMIGVLPEFQGRGVGKQILQYMIDLAKSANRSKIFLEVRANNPAIKFYTSLMFTQIGIRPNYYVSNVGNRFDAVTMQRLI
jgi:[ribosomal protein S18]-alanine N-acetyltransferase